jgi:hypothetical protein
MGRQYSGMTACHIMHEMCMCSIMQPNTQLADYPLQSSAQHVAYTSSSCALQARLCASCALRFKPHCDWHSASGTPVSTVAVLTITALHPPTLVNHEQCAHWASGWHVLYWYISSEWCMCNTCTLLLRLPGTRDQAGPAPPGTAALQVPQLRLRLPALGRWR